MKPGLRVVLGLAALLIAPALFVLLRLDQHLNFSALTHGRDALRAIVAQHGALSLAGFVFMYFLMAAFAIPGGIILTLAGGFLFGSVVAGLAVATSATLGATALFCVARFVLHGAVERYAGRAINRIRAGFAQGASTYMLVLRLTPVIPFWIVNLGAAAAGIPVWTFVWTTALGILPASFVFARAGEELEQLVAASEARLAECRASGEADCALVLPFDEVLSGGALLTLFGLSALGLISGVARLWLMRRGAASGQDDTSLRAERSNPARGGKDGLRRRCAPRNDDES